MTRIPKSMFDQIKAIDAAKNIYSFDSIATSLATDQLKSLQSVSAASTLADQLKSLQSVSAASTFADQVKSLQSMSAASTLADQLKSLRSVSAASTFADQVKSLQSVSAASALADQLKSLQSVSAASTFADQVKSLQSVSAASTLADQLKSLQSVSAASFSVKQINASLAFDRSSYLNDTVEIYRKISDAIGPYRSYFPDISIQDDVALVSGETIDLNELNNDIETISEIDHSLEEFLDGLLSEAERLTGPAKIVFFYILDKIILTIILGIFINTISPKYQDWWDRYSDVEPRVAQKEIIQEANDIYVPDELIDHRFVVAKSGLIVRHVGNRSGDVIGVLPFGTVVEVLEKSKDWSLVEYHESDSDEIVQGWVFTRYIRKFQ